MRPIFLEMASIHPNNAVITNDLASCSGLCCYSKELAVSKTSFKVVWICSQLPFFKDRFLLLRLPRCCSWRCYFSPANISDKAVATWPKYIFCQTRHDADGKIRERKKKKKKIKPPQMRKSCCLAVMMVRPVCWSTTIEASYKNLEVRTRAILPM